jgi:hypothetical protein
MNPQTAFLLLMLLLAVGSYGWGSAVVAALSGWKRISSERVRLDGPMNIAIGFALFLAVGGFAVAANVAYFVPLLTWLIVGAILALVLFIRRADISERARHFELRVLLPAVCALGGLALALAPVGLAKWSEADDAPAYTYLSQRLLATGGLIDPFNSRRIQNYGGAELAQALVVKIAGTSAINGIEAFFFCVLAIALLIRSLRRPYAAVVLLTVGLLVVLVQPVGDWSNTGPTFSETALVLALARLFADNQRRDADQTWLFIVGGLLLAGLFSLRPQGVPAAVAVLVAAACFAKAYPNKLKYAVVAGFSGVVMLLGWAIALKRSSDAWVFGFSAPYWTQASWSINPKIKTLGQHLSFILKLARIDSWNLGVIGALILLFIAGSLVYLASLRAGGTGTTPMQVASSIRLDLVLALIIGNIGLLFIFGYVGDGDASDSIGHYFAPILLAFVLFCIDRTWVLATSQETARQLRRPQVGLIGVSCIVFIYLFCDTPPHKLRHELSASARLTTRLLSGKPLLVKQGQAREDALYRPYYDQMNRIIPAGSYVLSAVEFPGLLDFKRFRFATVDEAYGASPPPHLPSDGNPQRTVKYLESLGFTGIVGDASGAPFYYNYADNYLYSHQGIRNYTEQDGSLVKWDITFANIQKLYNTASIGDLQYVPFDSPRA